MDDSELELYNLQLAQVKTALESDPDNAELQNLKAELQNLIQLSQSLAQSTQVQSAPASAETTHQAESSQPAHSHSQSTTTAPTLKHVQPSGSGGGARSGARSGGRSGARSGGKSGARQERAFSTGQEVLARYASDGRFYPARIVAVGGDPANPIFTVVYKGYGNTEMLSATALKPIQPHAPAPPSPVPTTSTSHIGPSIPPPPPPPSSTHNLPPPPPPSADTFPPPPPPTSGAMDDKTLKKHRNEKKLVRREQKSALQIEKAASWQKFASKATRNKTLKKSIFGTSDDPYAKVGVSKSSSSNNPRPGPPLG